MRYEPVYNVVKETGLAYSTDSLIRYNSTAGGYISILLKFLFDTGKIDHTISFERSGIRFYPKIISSFNEYNNIGSLYQEIDIIHFIKQNLHNIKGKIAITLLPCQVNIIRSIAKQNNIDIIIISLVCSAQMKLECTQSYFDLEKIDIKEVSNFRYRGFGWPKYINIEYKNGKIFQEKTLWNEMFHSYLFHEKRCLKCTDTFGIKSDIAVSDPWLGKMMKEERIGQSIVYIFSDLGLQIHKELKQSKYICYKILEKNKAISSQYHTMEKKYYLRKSKLLRKIIRLLNQPLYKSIILLDKRLLKIHSKVINKIIRVYIKLQKKGNK